MIVFNSKNGVLAAILLTWVMVAGYAVANKTSIINYFLPE
jgi:hypothetical protein